MCQELQIFAFVCMYLVANYVSLDFAIVTLELLPWMILLLVLLLLLLLFVITFMQGIYINVPQTNHVSRVYSFAATLYLQFMLHAMLFPTLNVLYSYITTSRSVCATPNMAALCSSLISCFPGMLRRYCPNYCYRYIIIISSSNRSSRLRV